MSDTESTQTWDNVSYIVSSTYRTAVCGRLIEGAATPSTIAEDTDLELAHVSRSVKQLRERGIVDLLVSESTKKGRVYGASDTGRAAYALAEEQGMV